jgi:DNA-directed RNA polymerase specialized sigma24 family protein
MSVPSRHSPWPKTSHWSEIAAACRPDSPDNRRAFDALCDHFREPVYSHIRRSGCGVEEAQDLAQEFFLFLLDDSQPLSGYDRSRSRFRTFLLAVLKNYLKGRQRHASALKRGGGANHVSIDNHREQGGDVEGTDATPEVEYTRSWAATLIAGVLGSLRAESAASSRVVPIEPLLSRLLEGKSASYDDMAATLGMTAGALRVAALRLRKRFEELLRAEIARTVPRDEDVDDEIRELFAAYSRPSRP